MRLLEHNFERLAMITRSTPASVRSRRGLHRIARNGVNVFFDNVGQRSAGNTNDVHDRPRRIAVCGIMGEYNDQENADANRDLWQLVVKGLTLCSFLTADHDGRPPEAARDLAVAAHCAQLFSLLQMDEGLENALRAFIDFMSAEWGAFSNKPENYLHGLLVLIMYLIIIAYYSES